MKSLIITLILNLFLTGFCLGNEKSKKSIPKNFQYLVQYEGGRIEKTSNVYESYLFSVELSDTVNKDSIQFTAKLINSNLISNPPSDGGSTISESRKMGNSTFYETGYPVEDISDEWRMNFLEGKILEYVVVNNKVRCINADTIISQFDKYLTEKIGQRNRRDKKDRTKKINLNSLNGFFYYLFMNVPKDLENPGDYSLVKRKVYQYKEKYNDLMKIEINRVTYFIDPETNLAWSSNNGKNRIICEKQIKNIKSNPYNTIISGNIPNSKSHDINCVIEELNLHFETRRITCNVDDSGNFSLPLLIQKPTFIKLDKGIEVYCEPGYNIHLQFNEGADSVNCTGIGQFDTEFLQKKKYYSINRKTINWRKAQNDGGYIHEIDEKKEYNLNLLSLYEKELSPRFFEHQYSSEFYKAINTKLFLKSLQQSWPYTKVPDCFAWYKPLHNQYQTFTNNQEYNKFLIFKLCNEFDRIRNYRYIALYDAKRVLEEDDLLSFARIYYYRKQLIDLLATLARQYFSENNIPKMKELELIAYEKFPNSPLSDFIKELHQKNLTTSEGKIFPKIKLLDLEGDQINLCFSKRKLNYLMIWRNDAFVFNNEWNEFKSLAESEKGNINFINIGIDDSINTWREQVKTVNYPGANLFLRKGDQIVKTYFRSLKSRHYFLIDKHGKILSSNGPEPKNLLKELPKYEEKSDWKVIVKYITGSILVMAIVMVVFILIIKRNAKRRAKIDAIKNQVKEMEMKAIKSQMNPHFLFNSLNSIQSMINGGKVENANKYLSKFASLLRSVLKNSEKEFISLKDEIENITLYCDLEKLRFNFEFNISINSNIDLYNTMFPPLLIQPFVENAILHGLHPKDKNKLLELEIDEIADQMYCIIRDNGVGRKVSENNGKGNGIGMKLSQERIDILNEKNKCDFKINVLDLYDDENLPTGTEIVISFTNNLI